MSTLNLGIAPVYDSWIPYLKIIKYYSTIKNRGDIYLISIKENNLSIIKKELRKLIGKERMIPTAKGIERVMIKGIEFDATMKTETEGDTLAILVINTGYTYVHK